MIRAAKCIAAALWSQCAHKLQRKDTLFSSRLTIDDPAAAGQGRNLPGHSMRDQNDRDGLALLGIWRFVLASAVMASHLWNPAFPDAGRHAVAGFFVISGFLITKIANEVYAERPVEFVINRFLRIYPTYWFCTALCIGIYHAFPETIKLPTGLATNYPSTTFSWINNIALVSYFKGNGLIIAQAWSLDIEICFYLVIGLATSRSRAITLVLFALTTIYSALSVIGVTKFSFYFTPQSCAFLFFGGSVAYFYAPRVEASGSIVISAGVAYAVSMFVLPFMVSEAWGQVQSDLLLFLSGGASVLLLLTLRQVNVRVGDTAREFFDWLGKLSYPVFLLHLFLTVPVASVIGVSNRPLLLVVTYAITIAVSAVIVRYIEAPVEVVRTWLRGSASDVVRDKPMRTTSTVG